ncbi:MAG: hypothetical protein ACREC8_10335 [Limisphaerales bacterium]
MKAPAQTVVSFFDFSDLPVVSKQDSSGVNQSFPDILQTLPGIRKGLPDFWQAFPDMPERFPDLPESFSDITRMFPDLPDEWVMSARHFLI